MNEENKYTSCKGFAIIKLNGHRGVCSITWWNGGIIAFVYPEMPEEIDTFFYFEI